MISKANALHYTWGEVCDGWRLVNRDDLSVIHERMPPGSAEVRHYHRLARQFFFVLAGTATLEIDGRREVLQAQQGLEVPPLVPHQIHNLSDAAVEFLVISHPSTRDDRVLADALSGHGA
ncbi:MAG: cupin domain-containing protein [Anaerolineae bacterium]|nr:cupin domain-containing protein [Anaerolineae bacterium]